MNLILAGVAVPMILVGVVASRIVESDAIEYVLPKNNETLTLYTCTGFADTDRYIVVAKPL